MPKNEDPLDRLEHDHGQLSKRLGFVRALLVEARADSGAIENAVDMFQRTLPPLMHALVEHFAHEEQGIFPFVEARWPDLREEIGALVEGHDRIRETATIILALANRGLRWFNLTAVMFDRLDGDFAEHDRRERVLLEALAERLDGDARRELAGMLRGP